MKKTSDTTIKYIAVIVTAVIALLAFLGKFFIEAWSRLDLSKIDVVIAIFLIVGSIFFVKLGSNFVSYVNKDIGSDRQKDNQKDINRLKRDIDLLSEQVDFISKKNSNESVVELKPEEKEELISKAKKRIIGNTLNIADVDLRNEISDFKNKISLDKHYSDVVARLENEINRLNRRGGINLSLGAFIAFLGIIYLGFTVTNPVDYEDNIKYLIYMIPKITFVFVIELFAYFFLRLYKSSFDEVKYFQNELTNIDSKVLGIKYLNNIKNEELMIEVVKNLMGTERNFILEKGQSTVLLDKYKISNDEIKNALEIVKEAIKVKKS